MINSNPLDEIARPNSVKKNKKIRALTLEEEKAFVKAANADSKEPFRTMLLLSAFTGMRMGEVAALKPDDLLLNYTVINVCKTVTRDGNYKTKVSERTKTYAGLRMLKTSLKCSSCCAVIVIIISKKTSTGCFLLIRTIR